MIGPMIGLARSAAAWLWLALLAAAGPVAAEGGGADAPRVLVALDLQGDEIDGPAFLDTLRAYLDGAGIEARLETVGAAPDGHAGWVSLAADLAERAGVIGVLWCEPAAPGDASYDTYIVLLESNSAAVVVLPVEIGARRGAEQLRVVAAAARMAIDAELLDTVSRIVQRAEAAPPPPEPPAGPSPPSPPPVPRFEPTSLALSAAYVLDVGTGGPSLLQGGRLGGALRLGRHLELHLDLGAIASRRRPAADLTVREVRAPGRVGAGWSFAAGPAAVAILAFWSVEAVCAVPEDERGSGDAADTVVRPDSGGGLELRLRVPFGGRWAGLVTLGGQVMAVSHGFTRGDAEAIHPSYVRVYAAAGVEIAVAGHRSPEPAVSP